MESAANTPDAPPRRPGVLPVLLAALVSPTDDPRRFLRYPVRLEVGVGPVADAKPEYAAQSARNGHEPEGLLSRRSVLVRDLSLTGLYFTSAIPYRLGSWLDVELALPSRVAILPCRVRRLDTPARTEEGALETAYGCAVDFAQSRVSPDTRRALMEFLVTRPC